MIKDPDKKSSKQKKAEKIEASRKSTVINVYCRVAAGIPLEMIEDIIDTGFTMQYVMDKLRKDGAADVKLATMLFKPDSLRCNLKPDYIGIRIPSDFIVGYGLDYDEMGRAYRNIYKIIDNW